MKTDFSIFVCTSAPYSTLLHYTNMDKQSPTTETEKEELVTKNSFKGFLRKQLADDSERLGIQPGRVVKLIVNRYYKRKKK